MTREVTSVRRNSRLPRTGRAPRPARAARRVAGLSGALPRADPHRGDRRGCRPPRPSRSQRACSAGVKLRLPKDLAEGDGSRVFRTTLRPGRPQGARARETRSVHQEPTRSSVREVVAPARVRAPPSPVASTTAAQHRGGDPPCSWPLPAPAHPRLERTHDVAHAGRRRGCDDEDSHLRGACSGSRTAAGHDEGDRAASGNLQAHDGPPPATVTVSRSGGCLTQRAGRPQFPNTRSVTPQGPHGPGAPEVREVGDDRGVRGERVRPGGALEPGDPRRYLPEAQPDCQVSAPPEGGQLDPSAARSTAWGSGCAASSRATSSSSAAARRSRAPEQVLRMLGGGASMRPPGAPPIGDGVREQHHGPTRAKRRSCGPTTTARATATGTGTRAPPGDPCPVGCWRRAGHSTSSSLAGPSAAPGG